MKDEHIISLIENTSLASLSENDLTVIRAHAKDCSNCFQAFQAAQVSQLLLKEHAAVQFEPSPFFHTRVFATLRERQAVNDSWAFGRLWRAAGALASSMVATVAALAFLTFVIPDAQVATVSQASSLGNGYSAEEVILDQAQSEEASEGQLLTTIYGGDEETR
jgi:carotenoid cleavage dioxygenase-like enzyme